MRIYFHTLTTVFLLCVASIKIYLIKLHVFSSLSTIIKSLLFLTGVGAKKTLVSKTSATKTKTVAAASAKVEKSEVTVGSVANGENKIAHEETSVEVIEKCAAEDILQCSSTEQVINTEPVGLIVNGDH